MRRALWGALAGGVLALAAAGLSRPQTIPPRDIPLPGWPETGPLTIVAFGTSLTAPPQTWPEDLARALTACRRAPVTVIRVAGPGRGSDWGIAHLPEVIAARPDAVLIEFAINDADLTDGVSVAQSGAQHQALITALKTALPQAKLILMTMSPAQGPRGWIRPFLADHYAKTVSIAAENGVFLIDHYARWIALPRAARGLAADGLHPDPAVAAGVILPGLMAGFGCDGPSRIRPAP